MAYRREVVRWSILWRSENKAEGKREYFINVMLTGLPMVFGTRREAKYANEEVYGYIRNRPDLKAEPHGWKMPKVVKVKATFEVLGG